MCLKNKLNRVYIIAYITNMTTVSATQARSTLFRIIDKVCSAHKPLTITKRGKNCVLVSEEDWSAMQETLYLLSIPGMRESLVKGKSIPLDKCVDHLPWESGK